MACVCDLDIFLFFRQSILIEERVDKTARTENIVFHLLPIPLFELPGLGTVTGNPTDAIEYIFGVLAMAG
jgi:hypothetical protein